MSRSVGRLKEMSVALALVWALGWENISFVPGLRHQMTKSFTFKSLAMILREVYCHLADMRPRSTEIRQGKAKEDDQDLFDS